MKHPHGPPALRHLLATAALTAGLLAATNASAAPYGGPTYKGAPVLGQIGPPEPSPTAGNLPRATAAGWSCQSGKCNYTKLGAGPWSDCFISWSPTHGGWLPTRYCR